MGCKSVIVTLGANGSVYAQGKELQYFPAPEIEAVDATGAGDAFVGALAFMLACKRHYPISKAIEVANYVASDSVTRPGSQKSFPDKRILQKLKVT